MAKPRPSYDVEKHLPLKPLVFQILLGLADGERHGWSLVRDVQQRGGFERLMPGNFYRTLRSMVSSGFIEESATRPSPGDDDERRRYFRLTELGEQVAIAEAQRLQAAVLEARARKLLTRRG